MTTGVAGCRVACPRVDPGRGLHIPREAADRLRRFPHSDGKPPRRCCRRDRQEGSHVVRVAPDLPPALVKSEHREATTARIGTYRRDLARRARYESCRSAAPRPDRQQRSGVNDGPAVSDPETQTPTHRVATGPTCLRRVVLHRQVEESDPTRRRSDSFDREPPCCLAHAA
jgi:hypothetical protein